jgi:excinuclease ABC subunit B
VNKITPRTVEKAVKTGIEAWADAEELVREVAGVDREQYEFKGLLDELQRQMELAARNLEFERAAKIRDRIAELKAISGTGSGERSGEALPPSRRKGKRG